MRLCRPPIYSLQSAVKSDINCFDGNSLHCPFKVISELQRDYSHAIVLRMDKHDAIIIVYMSM